MKDRDIFYHIEELVSEERKLGALTRQGDLSNDQRTRMQQLETYLDQCWDLLRQRRARRMAGLEPGDARLHDPDTTEYYAQ